jgi:ABC-2 type transport system permease protein
LLGKIIGNTILSITSFALTILYASILYHMPVSIKNLPLFVFSFLLTIVCFIVISLTVAYLLTLSRRTQLFMNCIDIPLTLICGFAFPVELLPQWMQHIAFALPLTWAVKLMRQSVLGNYIDFKKNLFALFITTMLFVLLSASSYKKIKQQIKINGTLEMV